MFSNQFLTSEPTPEQLYQAICAPKNLIAGAVAVTAVSGIALYKWWQEPWSFNKRDMIRYHSLKTAFIDMYRGLGNVEIHEHWELNGQQPKFVLNYDQVIIDIEQHIRELENSRTAISIASIGILSICSRYLESVSKRSQIVDKVTGAFERPDGIEAMFLVEFLSWFMKTVPTLPELSKQTINAFEKRTEYCDAIFLNLSSPHWHNENRANFDTMMKHLAINMRAYSESLKREFDLMLFHHLIEQLSDHLLSLTMQAINMQNLFIEGVHSSHLNIVQFMNPSAPDAKIITLRNTGLGTWLYNTLQIAGINTATCQSQNTITLNEILLHLENEHPNDESCTVRKELLCASSSEWGIWPFARETFSIRDEIPLAITTSVSPSKPYFSLSASGKKKTASKQAQEIEINGLTGEQNAHLALHRPEKNTEIKAKKYLEMMREMNREILWLAFLRQNVNRSKRVGAVFGEVWVYGSNSGRATLNVLLDMISDNLARSTAILKAFWDEFFGYYNEYSTHTQTNSMVHECHKSLNQINRKNLPDYTKTVEKTNEIIFKIKENAQKLPKTIEQTKKIQKELMQDLLSVMEYQGKNDTENFKIISDALIESENETHSLTPVRVTEVIEPSPEKLILSLEAQTIQCSKSLLPFYSKACRILFEEPYPSELASHQRDDLIPVSTQFNSDELQQIYLKYLVKHHAEAIDDYALVSSLTGNFFKYKYFNLDFYRALRRRTIAWDKLTNFRAVYHRVNAVYHLLYQSTGSPLTIEKLLIEQLIKKAILKDFEENNYYACLIPRFNPDCSCEENAGFFIIRLHHKMLNIGEGVVAEKIKLLQKTVEKVTRERDEAIRELEVKKNEVLEKENALQLTKEELGSIKEELGSTKEELASTKKALALKTNESEASNVALQLKTQELIRFKEELDLKEKAHLALLARLRQTPGLPFFSNTNEPIIEGELAENTVYQRNVSPGGV